MSQTKVQLIHPIGVTTFPSMNITGVVSSTAGFQGDLTGTASNATQLNSQAASYYLDYDNFSNTPTIPTNNIQLTNGAAFVTSSIINALSASNLSSGTIPDARFPSTLPAIDGSALTGIAVTANVRTGILDVAGIATFRGDTLVGSGVTLNTDGDGFFTGIVTATDYKKADGSAVGGLSSDSDGNTIGGTNAGDSITTGTNNTAIGKDAGTAITTGANNTGVGEHALGANVTDAPTNPANEVAFVIAILLADFYYLFIN